jgi:outer membrane protein assembly factor BamB
MDAFSCGMAPLLEWSESRPWKSPVSVALAAALLAGACTPSTEAAGPRAPAGTMSPVVPRLAVIWNNPRLSPIAQPTAIGKVVVGIVTEDRKLFVVGINPATGKELWRQQMTPSFVTAGVQVEIKKVDTNKVAYFRPTGEDTQYEELANLVVADAQTGNDIATSPEAAFTSPISVCTDGKDVCTISQTTAFNRNQYRLEIATGRYVVDSDRMPPGARSLDAPGLFDLGDRPGNTMALLRDGTLQWGTPVSAAFPPDFSSDNGWTWRLFSNEHVFVGSMYGKPLATSPRYMTDLANNAAMAGLAEATGEVLWRDPGSSFQCHLGYEHFPVRCRRHGIASYKADTEPSFEGLDITIEGFDPATGQTTWSVPIGAAISLVGGSPAPAIAGPTQVVLEGPKGPVVLDYATGDVRPPAPGATFWCMTETRYELSRPYRGHQGTWEHTRTGGPRATICDARGKPATALPSVAATLAAGAQVGGYTVLATPEGYLGFAVR